MRDLMQVSSKSRQEQNARLSAFYQRYGCKLGMDSLQEAFHAYLAWGHLRETAYRYAREYWRQRRTR